MSTDNSPLRKALQVNQRAVEHWWFSGRILACHAGGPGSIPGQCRAAFLASSRQTPSEILLQEPAPQPHPACCSQVCCETRRTSLSGEHDQQLDSPTCATSWLRGQGPRALQPSGDSCAPPAPASLQQEAVMKPVSCETVLHTTWTGEWGPHSERKPPESHWASCY